MARNLALPSPIDFINEPGGVAGASQHRKLPPTTKKPGQSPKTGARQSLGMRTRRKSSGSGEQRCSTSDKSPVQRPLRLRPIVIATPSDKTGTPSLAGSFCLVSASEFPFIATFISALNLPGARQNNTVAETQFSVLSTLLTAFTRFRLRANR